MDKFIEIGVFLIVFFLVNIFVKKWMINGKIETKRLIKKTLISLVIIAPMMFFIYYIDYEKSQPFLLYFFLLFVVYLIIMSFIKKVPKDYYYPILAGFIFYAIANFFDNILSMVFMIMGIACFFYGFYIMRKNPYYHYEWITNVVNEVAKNITEKGTYSSKPYIVKSENRKEFFTSGKGIKIWVKKDKIIYKINKKLFHQIGEPKLDLLFNNLTKIIIEKTNI